MKFAIVGLLALAGFIVGFATRPTFLGMPIPLNVLTSSYPADAAFKSELMQHLAMTTGAGAAVGIALAIIVAQMKRRPN